MKKSFGIEKTYTHGIVFRCGVLPLLCCLACTRAAHPYGNSSFDGEAVDAFYTQLFDSLTVDDEENAELVAFFKANVPPQDSLVSMRAAAFKSAVEFLSDDRDKNVALMRCINAVLHQYESTCLR
jgi:hypothetical protein